MIDDPSNADASDKQPENRRILLVTNYYPPFMVGGAEVVAHRQVLMLRKRGWDVIVFAGRAANNLADVGRLDVSSDDGVPVYRLSHAWMDTGRNFRNDFATKIFVSLIQTFKPEWVHFHNLIGLGTDLIPIAKRSKLKTALTLHDYWGICHRGILVRRDWSLCDDAEMCGYCCETSVTTESGADVPIRLRRDYVAWCLEQVDVLVSPSKSLADNYNALGFSRPILPFTNGIDLRTIQVRVRSPLKQIRFVCASYIGEHKGIPELIEALRLLSKKTELLDRWTFTLAGGGHIEQQVLDLADEIPDQFQFLGKVKREEMLRRLHDSDVVVLASIWPENEPVSLLEGLASGAAIVATRLGGNIEIVGDDRAGILVEPRSPEALAEAFERLILSPTLISDMSTHNIERAKSFDEEKTGDFLEKLYDEPIPPSSSSERVIICGGGAPDPRTRQMIDALAFSGGRTKVRLLWQDWIGDMAWDVAVGFWWWGKHCDLGLLTAPLSRGLPVCVRSSDGANEIARHLPVALYHDETSFIDWVEKLEVVKREDRQFVDVPLLRQYNRLRSREDFFFPC